MSFIKQFFYSLWGKKNKSPNVRFIDEDTGSISKTMPISIRPTQHYIIKREGQYHIYDSIEDMDSETRALVAKMDKDEAPFTLYLEGEKKTFRNINEVPEEIRKAIKEFEKKNHAN